MNTENEQELVDRLTGRLRGFQTNREYWTEATRNLPPFMMDADITSQAGLISKHINQQGEVVNVRLVVDLWRAWAGVNQPWMWYSPDRGKKFQEWLDEKRPEKLKPLLMPPVRIGGARGA